MSNSNIDLAQTLNRILDLDKGKQLFIGFIFVGIIVKIFLGFAQPATALIWGYFIIIFSIIGLLFLSVDINQNDMEAVKKFFQPLLFLIIILLWNISINLKYFKEINKHTIPNIYYTWSHFSAILIISIVILSVLGYVTDKPLYIYNYILLIMNLIVTGIQQVILDSFTVDG